MKDRQNDSSFYIIRKGCNMINRNASFRFTETVDKMKIYNNITERKVKE